MKVILCCFSEASVKQTYHSLDHRRDCGPVSIESVLHVKVSGTDLTATVKRTWQYEMCLPETQERCSQSEKAVLTLMDQCVKKFCVYVKSLWIAANNRAFLHKVI